MRTVKGILSMKISNKRSLMEREEREAIKTNRRA